MFQIINQFCGSINGQLTAICITFFIILLCDGPKMESNNNPKNNMEENNGI